ncbi:MAG: hypothetical protein RR502_10650, partial [Oscillospiraceae bacterium]
GIKKDFLNGFFTASGTISPLEQGYGIFYPQGVIINGAMKYETNGKVAIKKLSTDNTFNVEGYYFLPISKSSQDEDEVTLICESSPKWEFEFQYNAATKTWSIEEDD